MRTHLILALIAAATAAMPTFAVAQQRVDVPIMIGGNAEFDACGGVGVIAGLDPRGDGFLSVRGGPETRYREIDRLVNGNRVHVCAEKGPWIAIAYPADGRDCRVGSPWPKRRAYTGPCRHGWVHSRFIKMLAG